MPRRSSRDGSITDRLEKLAEDVREQEVISAGSPLIKANNYKHLKAMAEHLQRGGGNWPYRSAGVNPGEGGSVYAWTIGGYAGFLWEMEHHQNLKGNTAFHTLMRRLRRKTGAQGPFSAGIMSTYLKCYGPVTPGVSYPPQPPFIVDFATSGFSQSAYTEVVFQPVLMPGRPAIRGYTGGSGGISNPASGGTTQIMYQNIDNAYDTYTPLNTGIGWGVQKQAGEQPFDVYPGISDLKTVSDFPYKSGSPSSTYEIWGWREIDMICPEPPFSGGPMGSWYRGYTELGSTGPSQDSSSKRGISAATALSGLVTCQQRLALEIQDPIYQPLLDWYAEMEELWDNREEHVWMPFGDLWASFDYQIRYGWVHLRGRIPCNSPAGNTTYLNANANYNAYQPQYTPDYRPDLAEKGSLAIADAFTAMGSWQGKPVPVRVRPYTYSTTYVSLWPHVIYPGQNYVDLDGISWPAL